MANNHEAQHRRRSIRLKGYDYSQNGAYFITLCTHNNRSLFGTLDSGRVGANNHSPAVALNDAGMAVANCWLEIPDHFPFVELDAFITMPNHVHGILLLTADRPVRAREGANDYSPLRCGATETVGSVVGANNHSPRCGTSETVGSVVRGFKIGVTRWFRLNRPEIATVWQRNYYEHVIRNEQDLNEIRQYIATNPIRAKERRPLP